MPIIKFKMLNLWIRICCLIVVFSCKKAINIRMLRAVRYKFITGGYPPSAKQYSNVAIIVLLNEKVDSLSEMRRAQIIIAFHDNTGIIKKAKYMNDSI